MTLLRASMPSNRHSIATMFSYMLAMFDYNVIYGSKNATAAMLLFIAFEVGARCVWLGALAVLLLPCTAAPWCDCARDVVCAHHTRHTAGVTHACSSSSTCCCSTCSSPA
jgi:hypothetical protein